MSTTVSTIGWAQPVTSRVSTGVPSKVMATDARLETFLPSIALPLNEKVTPGAASIPAAMIRTGSFFAFKARPWGGQRMDSPATSVPRFGCVGRVQRRVRRRIDRGIGKRRIRKRRISRRHRVGIDGNVARRRAVAGTGPVAAHAVGAAVRCGRPGVRHRVRSARVSGRPQHRTRGPRRPRRSREPCRRRPRPRRWPRRQDDRRRSNRPHNRRRPRPRPDRATTKTRSRVPRLYMAHPRPAQPTKTSDC